MPVSLFLLWFCLVWASGWLFFPVASRILGDVLPDAGLAVGRALFLALWTLGAFWAGTLGVPTHVSAFGWLIVAGVGFFFALRDRRTLASEIKKRRRALIGVESIFLLIFLLFFVLRGFWSDTNGNNGEKSMDSALIGSLARAQRLPPPNPYAAGAVLGSYYYFGHLETALLTDATFNTTRWTYNLMCTTLPALSFSILFSLGAALTGRLGGGLFVSATVLGLGTLQPLYQWLNPDLMAPPRPFKLDFFAVSRVIPFTINEFPWFTFNQSDLHAHYFDFPFALTTMCLALALFRGQKKVLWLVPLMLGVQIVTNTWDFPAYGLLIGLAVLCGSSGLVGTGLVGTGLVGTGLVGTGLVGTGLVGTGLVGTGLVGTGLVGTGLVGTGAQTTVEAEPPVPVQNKKKGKKALPESEPIPPPLNNFTVFKRLGLAALLLFVPLLIAAPFLLHIKSAANPPRFLHQPASPLREWLLLWGPCATAWFGFMAYSLFEDSRTKRMVCLVGGLLVVLIAWRTHWNSPPNYVYQPSSLILPLILVAMGLAIWGAWKLEGENRFLCLMAICGLLALLWSETTWAGFLGDPNNLGVDDYKRQDTVFKFGLQTWMLWGIAATSGAWRTRLRWPEWLKYAFVPALSVMWIASIAVVFGRTRNFSAWDGWDGWAHLAPPEIAAADWLMEHTAPGENILEAENKQGGDYTPYTRYAHATGIPTIIGPQAHSFQWSPANSGDPAKEWAAVFQRKNDARTIWTVPDPKQQRALLDQYKVRYLVFGELEQTEYGPAALQQILKTFPIVTQFGKANDPHHVFIFENVA